MGEVIARTPGALPQTEAGMFMSRDIALQPGVARPDRFRSMLTVVEATPTTSFVLELDSSGAYQWHTFYGAGVGNSNLGSKITPDGSGNIYITGTCNGAWSGPAGQTPLYPYSGGIADMFVLKLDISGSYQWHTFYGSNGDDQAFDLTTDGSGDVYVVGFSDTSWNGPAGQPPLHIHRGGGPYGDILLLKLDSSGSYQWHTFYGSSDR